AAALEDLGADQEVVAAVHVVLGGFAGHVGERLVDAAGLPGVDQARVLLGGAVRDLVRRDVEADQRIEGAGAVTEGHAGAVPERVLVVAAVVHAHLQLERQRRDADVVLVHVEHDAPEVVRVVDRRVGAVDRLEGVAWAGVRERGAAAGAVVEVDAADVGVVHGAGAAALRHVQVTEVGAVLVLAGLLVAAGAGADLGGGQAVPLGEDLAAAGVDDHERAGR